MDLSSKTAIITGASSGIGAAFSRALVGEGATVYGLARSEDKLKKLQSELGDAFVPVKIDVTRHEDIRQWVDATFHQEHLPHILVNNAGLASFGDIDDLPYEEWHKMVHTNLSGIFYMCRLVVPLMKENEQPCHIVNISSIAGKVGNPQLSAYNATKFGVRGFSESLFKELRYDGIKVSCFYPGSTATDFFEKAAGLDTHPNMLQAEDLAQTLLFVLKTGDNVLINEIVMRPLNPKPPIEEP